MCAHLKDLLSGHLDATVSRLRLLQRQLVTEQLQLVDQVSLVASRHVSVSTSASDAASSDAAHSSTSHLLAPHVHLGGLGGFLRLGLLAGDDMRRGDRLD